MGRSGGEEVGKTNYEHAAFVPNHQQSSHINIRLMVQIDVDRVRYSLAVTRLF